MASPIAGESMEPPRKRQRLSPSPTSILSTTTATNHEPPEDEMAAIAPALNMITTPVGFHGLREHSVGILHFVNEQNPGFEGILKQRYTDFLVNEIDLSGNVLHLTKITAPKKVIAKDGALGVELPQVTEKTSSQESKKSEEKDQAYDKKRNSNQLEMPDKQPTPPFTITDADAALLEEYFGSANRSAILIMNTKIMSRPDAKAASFGSILTDSITDRQLRTKIHQDMRRIFNSRFETSSDENGALKISAAVQRKPNPRDQPTSGNTEKNGRGGQQKGKLGWEQLGGEYLHFTLYKENKDTMEIINFISARTKRKHKDFTFAGTKDRRAVTAQRVSAFRMTAEQLAQMNKDLYGAKVGNFKHEKHDLQLGDLSGNEFLITLRDCKFGFSENKHHPEQLADAKLVVGAAMENLTSHGFINYYGLQRFGSFGVGTDIVGKKILQGDYEGAVDCILSYDKDVLEAALLPREELSPQQLLYPKDDMERAWAIMKFKRTGSAKPAMTRLPRRFAAESVLITHLSSPHRSRDFLSALLKINRNLRLMYVHAYQSLVWNMAASERWSRFGGKVVKGDLVLVDMKSDPSNDKNASDEVDQNGEIVVLPAAHDVAISSDEMFQRARPLTAEEAASGKYTIFDIVLPTPGFDIEYPDNEIGTYYKSFMMSDAGGNLDPTNMRRASKDFSLSGSYRKVMGGIGKDWSYEIKEYYEENEQMVVTDAEALQGVDKTVKKAEPSHKGTFVQEPSNVVTSLTYTRPTAESMARTAADGTLGSPPATLAAKDESKALAVGRESEIKSEMTQATFKETTNDRIATTEPKIAVIVKFQLGSSQYATMALRELMKLGGVKQYQPEYNTRK